MMKIKNINVFISYPQSFIFLQNFQQKYQMGGHGGLNILPQKKWNVYNWDNREIVDRDKKLHAEKLRKEYEQNREDHLQRKIEVLKQDGKVETGQRPVYQQQQKPVHSLLNMEMRKIADEQKNINLFEEEERLLQNKEMSELKRLKEEEFLRDKNMDFSTRFLGSYAQSNKLPWYTKKKGSTPGQPKNKHYKPLDDVIYAAKTDSKVTKEVIESSKKMEQRDREENMRDRTREKFYRKYQEYEEKCSRLEKPQSRASQDIMKHEQNMLVEQFKKKKQDQIEKLRQKRLRREEKERKKIQQLKRKNGCL